MLQGQIFSNNLIEKTAIKFKDVEKYQRKKQQIDFSISFDGRDIKPGRGVTAKNR